MDDAGEGRITIRAALELPALRRGLPEVLAGASALDRAVRWVHAGEVPNIASLLRGGEILLTTGMGIGDRAAEQRRFVTELAARHVAALIIELGPRFDGRLPPALVRASEQHELPLVALHATVPFVAVTEAVHTEIVNHHYELLRRANELQERFTALMLRGGGVGGVMATLADAVGNPVFLESGDGRLVAWAAPSSETQHGDPVAAWSEAAGRADSLGIAAAIAGNDDGTAGRLLSLPTVGPFGRFAPLALERAAGIVALALLRSRQEEELLALGRGDLLRRLADGSVAPEAAESQARELGFAPRVVDALLPMVARLPSTRRANSAWAPVLAEVDRGLDALGLPVLIGVDPARDELLVLVALSGDVERVGAAGRVAAVVRAITERRLNGGALVAAGPAGSWEEVGPGLRDAGEGAAVAVRLPTREWHDATAMALDRLLWRLRDDDELARYVHELLGPVLEHDARRKHLLLPTLEALCDHGGRRAETARELHLNRQALYDRLARLERLLGADLRDPRTLVTYAVALRARQHASTND